MERVDCIIVGQGIAGSLLSRELLAAGKSVLVIDDGSGGKASRVAGAVINPLSGKNHTPAPGADYLLPAAIDAYRSLEALLEQPFLKQMPLYFFPESPAGSTLPPEEHTFRNSFSVWPELTEMVGVVAAAALLEAWKIYLDQQQAYLEETLDFRQFTREPGLVRYKGWEAGHIVFCEGAAAAANELFRGLPFTANRGEALLLNIPGLPADALYHRGLRLVPRSDGLFWCGSNYRWQFDNLEPDAAWRIQATRQLKDWLTIAFRVEAHLVAERPTTAGQVPLVGLHPQWPEIGILNGLGTRGFSSAPYWAAQLAKKLSDPGYRLQHYNEAWLHRKLLS